MGAIFSGVAMVIIIMAVLRRAFHLEEWITRKHFVYLGYLLAALAAVMVYFNLSEYLTEGYKVAGETGFHLNQLFTGPLAPYYWSYALGGLVAPILIVLLPWSRTIAGIVAASLLVTVGMWIERYLIVVGGLRVPLMPYEPATYTPTWVEWSIMAGVFAAFALLMALMLKVFPVMAIWEIEEEYEKEAARS
jgi:molybdopterin-containing oxidoreductase family membrane subunit